MTKQAASAARELARHLLEQEGSGIEPSGKGTDAALRVFEKLCMHLSKLIGVAGYQALLTRARVLAAAEVPWLLAVEVEANGTLVGFEDNARNQPVEEVIQGAVALLSQLLGLLVTFIGEALTLCLVQDVWSDVPRKG